MSKDKILVFTLQAQDLDIEASLTFALEDTINFVVDDITGEIFCKGECMESCETGGCQLKAKTTDGLLTATLQLTVREKIN